MAYICGVEEAGRGPVLGPMVMAACWIPEKDEELLRKVGVKDSKLLTPLQRERVFESLEELQKKKKFSFTLKVLSPKEIDAAVDGKTDNLNKLEVRISARLIETALQKSTLSKVYLDAPTVSTEKYAKAVQDELKEKITLISENKADAKYLIVGAASIIAKVTRDREIEKLKKKYNMEFGSGYPADPLTKRFVQQNHSEKKYDALFRKSWASYKNAVAASKQRSLFHFKTESKAEKEREQQHAEELKRFDALLEHGYAPIPPKTEYELLRLKGKDATIIKYTTGKLLVQGKGKAAAEKLLKRLGL